MVMLIMRGALPAANGSPGSSPAASAPTAGYQTVAGFIALASGGWFGVGLGASRAKWGWVPEAQTDFIFAIIGEELGLFGTLCVLVLFGGLAYAGLRIARRVPDTFVRLAAARRYRLARWRRR